MSTSEDTRRIKLVLALTDATIHAIHADSRNDYKASWLAHRRTVRALLTTLLGRDPTEAEVEQAVGGIA